MDRLKTLDELIQIAEEADPGLKKHKLRAESRPGQFPYQFSYCGPDDRFDGEFSEEEVRKVLDAPVPDNAIRQAFVIKMAVKSETPRIANL